MPASDVPQLLARRRTCVLRSGLLAALPGALLGALLAALTALPTVPVAAAAGGQVLAAGATVTVSEDLLWPNPSDNYQPRTTTVTYTPTRDGDYELWVTKGSLLPRAVDVGQLVAGQTYQWDWNGRDDDGDVVERGTYRVELMRQVRKNSFDRAGRSPAITVHNGTQHLYVRDRRREAGSGPVDLTWFMLVNAPDHIKVVFDFRRVAKPSLGEVTAALDVNNDWRGYLLNVRRAHGRWVTSLTLARLASDDNYRRTVRCPKKVTKVHPKRVTFTVPRACLKVGGRQMRANYWTSSRDFKHGDYGPEGSNYWTPWTWYETPPKS